MFTKYFKILCTLLYLMGSITLVAQDNFKKGGTYTIAGITVTGIENYNQQTVVTYTGLRVGQKINIPGEQISMAINKLWGLNLFGDINFYIEKIEGDNAFLEINIKELPTLSSVTLTGVKPKKAEKIIKEAGLKTGKKVTENLLTNTKNFLINKYKKRGFLHTKVIIATKQDTLVKNGVAMAIGIQKGKKVKVKNIVFTGNKAFESKKLRKALKNTKKRMPFRFWKRSKYIADDFSADLTKLIDTYKENGYRDARVIKDSLIHNPDNTVSLGISVEEGNKYHFGKIDFLGNAAYSDRELSRVLGIKKGDVYNGVLLKKRISDTSRPDGDDITNLYQNNGYLFSNVNPVEVAAQNDTIDFEVRIVEGKPAYFNNITVTGNDRTNDHVIYRELRTKPGQLYSKENIVRTLRELGQLGYFDPEQLSPNIKNPDPNNGTLDLEYSLVEKGSSQVELQGGYGGGGFIGTLGLSFNNFAIKDLFKKDSYKPLPMGDGQKLALRLQASRAFQTYSFSFTEPWLGGKQPIQFSGSLSHTIQFLFNPQTRNADKNKRFLITGITLGIAKRLRIPDDYFQLSQSVSLQHYNLKNYFIRSLFSFGNGFSNNLSYTVALTRNNTYVNPIYPLGGSKFTVSAKFTPPYSLFNKKDYADLENQDAYKLKDANGYLLDQDGNKVIDSGKEAAADPAKVDQEKFNWLEYYKIKFKGEWYTKLVDKLVLKTSGEFGFLGAYNNDRGLVPFERFYLGGDGLGNFTLDGRENVGLRGYSNQSLNPSDPTTGAAIGASVYNKFSLELRYPLTLKPTASIYGLTFLEAGAAYDGFKNYNPFLLQRSAGLGIRVFMPAFGLLGIDFGYGFDPVPGQTVKSGWQTHFIIGQQF